MQMSMRNGVTPNLKLTLTLTLTLTDTGGAVLTLMLGYRDCGNIQMHILKTTLQLNV